MSTTAKMNRPQGLAASLCGAVICVLLLPASSPATYDPLGSGTTKLSFDKKFLALMKAHGVKAVPKAPAKREGKSVAFPIVSGAMDPTIDKGEIDQAGVLIFRRGKRSLPFKKVMLKTKKAPLYAKVGGGQLKVATGAKIAVRRSGFGTVFTAKRLKLAEKVAVRLNKKLHLGNVFQAGQVIGSLRSQSQPQTVTILPTGRTTLAPSPEMLAKLNSRFVSLNPIFPAELAPGPLFSFPMIGGGAIAPDASAGTLRTGGSIEMLQLGSGQVFWHEFWFALDTRVVLGEVDVQPSPPYPGKVGQIPVFDLDLGMAAVSADPSTRTITVSGASVRLQAQTAAHLNQAFAEGKEIFKAGDLFGTISFAAKGQ